MISYLGDWFNLIAILVMLDEVLGHSAFNYGLVFFLKLLPTAIVSPLAGVIADKFDRRRVLIVSDLVSALIVLGFLFTEIFQNVYYIYFLVILQSSASSFFDPSKKALVPDIVKEEDIATANILSGILWSLMLAFGAALGGIATEVIGWKAVFILDALSYVISAHYIRKIKDADIKLLTPEQHTSSFRTSLMALVNYFKSNKEVAIISSLKGIFAIGFTPSLVLALYGKNVFPLSETAAVGISIFFFARGVATGIGPMLVRNYLNKHPEKFYHVISYGICLCGVFYAVLAYAQTLTSALIAVAIAHIGSSIFWVYSTVWLQENVPSYIRGRIFGYEFSMFTLSLSASILFLGHLIEIGVFTPQQASLEMSFSRGIALLVVILFLLKPFKSASKANRV
jgi:MFS family permease